MGLFRYEAVDKSGKVLRGVMNASSEQQVARKLTAMGYSTRGVYAAGGSQPATAAPARTAAAPTAARPATGMQKVTLASGVPVSIRSKVPASQLASYFRQLSTLVKSGMTVHQAFSEMAQVVRNPRLRRTLVTSQEAAQSGRSFSSAMAEYPDVFPVHTVASVWAGELAGRLEIALDEVASDLELEASEIRYGRIGWGIAKIHLIALIVLIPISNVVGLLLPALEDALKAGERSTWQQVLRSVWSNYVHNMLWKTMLGIVACIVLWLVWGQVKRIPWVKRMLDGALLMVPLWGRLHKDRALARFLHVMDGLYAAGLSPGQAWDAASLTVRNSALAERLRLARSRLSPTVSVVELFTASGVFPVDEIGMAASGEKTGRVPDVLSQMSAIYADKAAAGKTRNRVISVTLLNLMMAAMVVFVFARIVNSYVLLSEKAAELMGGP